MNNLRGFLLLCLILLTFTVKAVPAQEVAQDFTLTDIDGNEFSLSDFKGKSCVFLDFFATYCPWCIDEILHLKIVHEKFRDDLVIISISIDPSYDTNEKLRQFAQQYGVDWIFALDSFGVCKNYWQVIPTLVFIDRAGRICRVHTGSVGADMLLREIYAIVNNVDTNQDFKINIADVFVLAKAFGTSIGKPRWNDSADFDQNEAVNIKDVFILARKYGSLYNFLLNPSVEIEKFDQNAMHYGLPAFWQFEAYNDIGANSVWLETGRIGTRSVMVSIVHNASAATWHFANCYQPIWIPNSLITTGSKYLLRFWYKSSIRFRSFVSFYDSEYNWIGDNETEHEPSNAWTQSSRLEFVVSERTFSMKIGFRLYNSAAAQETDAYAIADDFELTMAS